MAKNMKRILSVTIKTMADDSPDTSHLGEYSDKATSTFSIDRAHDLDCPQQEYNSVTNEGSDHLQNAIEYLESEYEETGNLSWEEQNHWPGCSSKQDTYAPCDCHVQQEQTANTDARVILESARDNDCTCGNESDRWNNREHRYFNPSDKLRGPENTIKYTRQDYERMESFNNGSWCYIGIRAEAKYQVPSDRMQDSTIMQEITSGGLWGIESDSGNDYLESIEQEELSELRSQLHAIGFSQRAITAAFKTIERTEE